MHKLSKRAVIALIVIGVAACGGTETTAGNGSSANARDTYPAGPYGVAEGAIIDNLGFTDADGTPYMLEEIYKDPANRLLLVTTSAGWCTACIEEQPALIERHATYASRGLVILVANFEDANFNPIDADFAAQWRRRFMLPDVPTFKVVADSGPFLLGNYYDKSLTPMNMFIDLDTMKILRISTGFDVSAVDAIINSRL